MKIDDKNKIFCGERSDLILKIRTMESLKLDSFEAKRTLSKINSNFQQKLSCQQLIDNIQYFKNIDLNSTHCMKKLRNY
jgi:hypothetical protein